MFTTTDMQALFVHLFRATTFLSIALMLYYIVLSV